jgi:hypothetical protein
VVAGLALAAAILTKLFAVEAVLPALWILVVDRDAGYQGRAGIFLAAATLPVLLDSVLIAPAAQWSQVVSLHQAATTAQLPGLDSPIRVLGQFLELDLGLSIAAAAGLTVVVLVRRLTQAGFLLLWLGGMAVMLLAFRPLFPHHPAILLTALAVSAGVGWSVALSSSRLSARVVVLAGAAVYALALPRLVHADRHALVPGIAPTATALAAFVDARTPANRLVAVDDLEVADLAHRLVVPPLCDPSNVRLHAGYLTTGEVETATQAYRPALVLASRDVYEQIPGYLAWLGRRYHQVAAPEGATAYVPR